MTTLDTQVETRLRDSGVRYTSGRRAIIAALDDGDGPQSAAELHARLPSLPLSSIYRTLAVLEEAEILSPHLATKGIARFELAEWLAGHHHHLVCVSCGSVEDVDLAPSSEEQLEELVRSIGASAGFAAANHALEIEGRCQKCA